MLKRFVYSLVVLKRRWMGIKIALNDGELT
jgi:hypothetical protein